MLVFTTPWGALVALGAIPPLLAGIVARRRNARVRDILGLAPERESLLTVFCVAAVPLLLGLAAAGPAVRTHVGRKVRTDAQALFVLDTSRSMAASAAYGKPTRFAQAQSAAVELRRAIPEVPAGVASFTTEVIPHLFPTPDAAAFDTTVEEAVGVLKPPPPFFKFGISGTSFGPLSQLRNQGYFLPSVRHRYAIVVTDGESGPFDASALRQALTTSTRSSAFPGRPLQTPEPPVQLIVVRVGSQDDRIYRSATSVEAAFRPSAHAAAEADSIAFATGEHAYDAGDLSAAASALRRVVGAGRTTLQGVRTKTTTLAPYVVLLALLPLALVVRRRLVPTASPGRRSDRRAAASARRAQSA
jgi:hypothetical protein